MNVNPQTRLILIIVGIVALGGLAYLFFISQGHPDAISFFPTAQNASTTPTTPTTPVKQTTTTTPRKNSGFTVAVQGKTETITSVGAGVSLTAPVNTVVSQDHSILTVRPPESTAKESFQIQKTESSFADPIMQIPSALSGKQLAFDALRTAEDSSEYNPNNNLAPSHIQKLNNLTVDGHPAVQVHVTTSSGTGSRDFYLTWVRAGITNWYIVRTAQGLTPAAKSSLDTIFTSIKLLP